MRLSRAVYLTALCCWPTSNSAADWLQIPTDVRSRALGNAGTALPNLEFAMDANPALLTLSDHGGGGISYGQVTNLFSNNVGLVTAYGVVGTKPLKNRLAVSLAYSQFNEASFTTFAPYPSGGSDFTSAQLSNKAWLLGVGGVVTGRFSTGATLKATTHSYSDGLGNSTGTTEWGVDFGFYLDDLIPSATLSQSETADGTSAPPNKLSRPRSRGFSVGAAVRNFGERFERGADAGYVLPEEALSMGVSFTPILLPDLALLLVTEAWVEDPLGSSPYRGSPWVDLLRWGVETSVERALDLRFGMESHLSNGDARFTVGAGLGPERIRLNVAMSWDIVPGFYDFTDEAEQRLGLSVQL